MSKEKEIKELNPKDENSIEERYLRGDLEKFVMDNIENCKMFNGNVDWAQMVYITEQEFGDEFTKDKLRSIYRKHTDPKFTSDNSARARQSEARKEKITLRDQIIKRIKNKCSIDYLFDTISHPDNEILAELSRMELDGYMIDKWSENGNAFVKINDRRYESSKEIDLGITGSVSVAVIGDLHIGHEKFEKEYFKSFMDMIYDRGIRNVVVTGDIFEGNYMSIRPTSVKELVAIGYDDQMDLVLNTLPKKEGLHYYAISGNHDWTFERAAFANPVKALTRIRDDISFLGHNFGRLKVTDAVDIAIVHPTDGVGQNYGLKLHQYIDRAEKNKQAQIILMGHYHKHANIYYKGVHGFITPGFVSQSKFMKDNNLRSVVGGIILHMNIDKDGKLVSLMPEYYFKD